LQCRAWNGCRSAPEARVAAAGEYNRQEGAEQDETFPPKTNITA
jgi:chaperonin cofactor prefoldin